MVTIKKEANIPGVMESDLATNEVLKSFTTSDFPISSKITKRGVQKMWLLLQEKNGKRH